MSRHRFIARRSFWMIVILTSQLHYFMLLCRQFARKVGTSANSALIRYYFTGGREGWGKEGRTEGRREGGRDREEDGTVERGRIEEREGQTDGEWELGRMYGGKEKEIETDDTANYGYLSAADSQPWGFLRQMSEHLKAQRHLRSCNKIIILYHANITIISNIFLIS